MSQIHNTAFKNCPEGTTYHVNLVIFIFGTDLKFTFFACILLVRIIIADHCKGSVILLDIFRFQNWRTATNKGVLETRTIIINIYL